MARCRRDKLEEGQPASADVVWGWGRRTPFRYRPSLACSAQALPWGPVTGQPRAESIERDRCLTTSATRWYCVTDMVDLDIETLRSDLIVLKEHNQLTYRQLADVTGVSVMTLNRLVDHKMGPSTRNFLRIIHWACTDAKRYILIDKTPAEG